MGVTHPDALDHYRFSLESIEARDESEVYVISVRPKRGTFSGFDGTIRVLDGEYAMIAAELQPSEGFPVSSAYTVCPGNVSSTILFIWS